MSASKAIGEIEIIHPREQQTFNLETSPNGSETPVIVQVKVYRKKPWVEFAPTTLLSSVNGTVITVTVAGHEDGKNYRVEVDYTKGSAPFVDYWDYQCSDGRSN